MAGFNTRLESFRDRIEKVSPTPAVLMALLKELVNILIKNHQDQIKAYEKAVQKKAE